MDIQQRVAEFLKRLEAAGPVATSSEAFGLVCRLLEEVENEFCPIPPVPTPGLRYTGRMYAPQEDHIRRRPNGTIVADARHHRVFCHPNGDIVIEYMPSKATVFYKKGKRS
jgi:hypothetical protein